MPASAFTHADSAPLAASIKAHAGRDLFAEHRCVKCHGTAATGMPELAMDAPSFNGIGSRRQFDWLAPWV